MSVNVIFTDGEGKVFARYEDIGPMALDECERWLAPYEVTEEK